MIRSSSLLAFSSAAEVAAPHTVSAQATSGRVGAAASTGPNCCTGAQAGATSNDALSFASPRTAFVRSAAVGLSFSVAAAKSRACAIVGTARGSAGACFVSVSSDCASCVTYASAALIPDGGTDFSPPEARESRPVAWSK
ncbi:hypothetical protein VSH64_12030 [Amycolatopsis rhabdoformis]|uniref:Secreted protein n=1 Tax=Amycolatopsis rhabdoformis TaxID=1448059 RepID=A0ABZ1IF91_9PSEU|nr:hypothetical protein [Amycolatopsis rhabdoformis]WSE32833.1 hypothetical protein VSH64_12030 [Amycolatopsis rhabdoformis]